MDDTIQIALTSAITSAITASINWYFTKRIPKLNHEFVLKQKDHDFENTKYMDRKTKLSLKEFEILPLAWQKITESFEAIKFVLIAFRPAGENRELVQTYHTSAFTLTQLASVYISVNGMFIQEDIKNEMKELLRINLEAITERALNIHCDEDGGFPKARKEFETKGRELHIQIEAMIKAYIRPKE